MFNQTITDIKVQYNILKYKMAKIIKVAKSPVPMMVLVEHRDASGKLLYHNLAALINQGEESVIKSYFQNVAVYTPSNFKVNLATDATIAEAATNYTAVSGTGYAEVAVAHNNSDWTATKPVDSWLVTSKNCVFTAGGTWTLAKKIVLSATLNSVDILIAYADLTGDRQLYSGDTLTCSLVMSLE
jgi:predicted glycosyltransferase